MPVMGPLETERLILRPSRSEDAVVHRLLWTERDPRVPPHRKIDASGRPTVQDLAAQLDADPQAEGPRLLTVQRRDAAETIGYCGLIQHGNGSSEVPELAYELRQSAQGCGYATEAARAIVGWAGAAGYQRLTAGVWDWNVASRRVLEKLGFRETGRIEPRSVHGHTLLTVKDL